jgi:hypothetical protein
MSLRKPSHSIDTAVGRVDAQQLEECQENFETHRLLELVDALDEWCGRIVDPDGLRADLLRLHVFAHTLINGIAAKDEAIWELAGQLESEFLDIAEGAKHAISLLRPLTRLAPDE